MMFLQNIKHAAKLVRGVLAGYDGLQTHEAEGWEYVSFSSTAARNWDGSYSGSVDFALLNKPFYVCVVWKNGAHTPLPVILGDDSEYPVQKFVTGFFSWLWNKMPFCPDAWRAATMDCARYKDQWLARYKPIRNR